MFSASMALSFSTTIVVFSPSARGSRSLLERMHDFVRLLGAEKRVLSYNQENLRVRALDGGVSLLRSFPSKIEVCRPSNHPIHSTKKHTLRPLFRHTHTIHTRREEDPSTILRLQVCLLSAFLCSAFLNPPLLPLHTICPKTYPIRQKSTRSVALAVRVALGGCAPSLAAWPAHKAWLGANTIANEQCAVRGTAAAQKRREVLF